MRRDLAGSCSRSFSFIVIIIFILDLRFSENCVWAWRGGRYCVQSSWDCLCDGFGALVIT